MGAVFLSGLGGLAGTALATRPGGLALQAGWIGPQLMLNWHNTGPVALAIWTHLDTDSGMQHDALRLETGPWSAALMAPRKSAAARWCALAAGQRHAIVIDLASWRQRLQAPAVGRSGWRLAYDIGPDAGPGPTPLPICGQLDVAARASSAGPPATPVVWRGRLVVTRRRGQVLNLALPTTRGALAGSS